MGQCVGKLRLGEDQAAYEHSWRPAAGLLNVEEQAQRPSPQRSSPLRSDGSAPSANFMPKRGGTPANAFVDDSAKENARAQGGGGGAGGAPSPDLSEADWTRGELIGAGAFGRVYLGLNNESGQLMAVKQVTYNKDRSVAGRVGEHLRGLEDEVSVLRHLRHPNIVRYLGTQNSQECLNIFLEFVPGGSIASLLAKFGSFKESVIRVYARQILLGLEYLHANKIMHRDVKGANILVDNTGLVKLADFGASKKIEDLVTIDSNFRSIKGTPYWMAPEVITQTGHGRQADIWSVACTVIEMATGKPPWSHIPSQVTAMFHIAKTKDPPPIPETLSPECRDFLILCFNRNPKERPTAKTLLGHDWLRQSIPRGAAAPLTISVSADARVQPDQSTTRLKPELTAAPSPIPEESGQSAGRREFPTPRPHPTALGASPSPSGDSAGPSGAPEPRSTTYTPRPYSPGGNAALREPRRELEPSRLSGERRASGAATAREGGEKALRASGGSAASVMATPEPRTRPPRGRAHTGLGSSGEALQATLRDGLSPSPADSSPSHQGPLAAGVLSSLARARGALLPQDTPSTGASNSPSSAVDLRSSMESEYNPVEEPSWMQSSTFDAGQFRIAAQRARPDGGAGPAGAPPGGASPRGQLPSFGFTPAVPGPAAKQALPRLGQVPALQLEGGAEGELPEKTPRDPSPIAPDDFATPEPHHPLASRGKLVVELSPGVSPTGATPLLGLGRAGEEEGEDDCDSVYFEQVQKRHGPGAARQEVACDSPESLSKSLLLQHPSGGRAW